MNPIAMIKQYLNIIIGVLIAIVTFYFSSIYYNHKIDKVNKEYNDYKVLNEKNIEAQKLSIISQTNKLNQDNIALNNKLKEVENERYKTYAELQKANNTIKSNISNGSSRLYINAKCAESTNNSNTKAEDSTATRVDDGRTSKAVIDSRDAESIIEITNKGDKYKAQLEGLQEWVNKLIQENNK